MRRVKNDFVDSRGLYMYMWRDLGLYGVIIRIRPYSKTIAYGASGYLKEAIAMALEELRVNRSDPNWRPGWSIDVERNSIEGS